MRNAVELFGVSFHPWTMDETVDAIARRVEARSFTQLVVLNVAKIVNLQKDPLLRDSVLASDIVGVDGMGLVWGARLLGADVPERVAGIDLFDRLLALSARRKWPVFLLGAKPEIVASAVTSLENRFPDLEIAGYHHGYFWDDEKKVVELIRASGARLLFVAITSPKKENFINRWQTQLGVDFVMGIGGSLDIAAGVIRRAPKWMQRAGLEWLFRTMAEPRRMWRRYLVTNTYFAGMLAKEWWRRRT